MRFQAALLALSVVCFGGSAAASSPTREGPSWAHHAQTTIKHEGGRIDLARPAAIAAAVTQSAPSKTTRLVPPSSPVVPLPGKSSIKAEILREPPPGKLKIVVDLESQQKAVWIVRDHVVLAIPIETINGQGAPKPVAKRAIATATKQAVAAANGWKLPTSLVVNEQTGSIGVRRGKAITYIEGIPEPRSSPPVTSERKIRLRRRLIARR
ncbi:MAG: hypothetical protein IT372_05855 [Polyangiaceae bacterium]|nr:hypothetical protein [Polyangiaceae bacterium]